MNGKWWLIERKDYIGWIVGWMNGWMDEWMDGWIDRMIYWLL